MVLTGAANLTTLRITVMLCTWSVTKNISSTKLRGEGTTYTVGVVTDNDQDNGIVWETKYVSGLHVECVFSENAEAAESFCDKYELDSYYSVEADNGEWQQGFDCFCPR